MLLSGLGFGSTGAITRSLEASAWQIASWRGLIGGAVVLVYAGVRGRRRYPQGVRQAFGTRQGARQAFGVRGLTLSGLCALSMILFISALQNTAVANVAVITATVPFIAAALGRVVLNEGLRRLTVVAALASFAGVLVTVGGGITLGSSGLGGNLQAVALALTLAWMIVLIRRFESADARVDAVLAMGGGGVMLFVLALAVADPLGITADQLPMLAVFGAIFGLSVLLWTEGVKLIPAAEAGLLASSETPFSIALAWMFAGESPPLAAVVGGLIVVSAVLGHAGADLVHQRVSRPWLRPRLRPRL